MRGGGEVVWGDRGRGWIIECIGFEEDGDALEISAII